MAVNKQKRFTLQRPAAHSDVYVLMDHTLLCHTCTLVTHKDASLLTKTSQVLALVFSAFVVVGPSISWD